MYRVPGSPELPVDKNDLTSKRLLDPEVNLAVGAALLEMWQAGHKEIDAGVRRRAAPDRRRAFHLGRCGAVRAATRI
jgi:hypothetical protein